MHSNAAVVRQRVCVSIPAIAGAVPTTIVTLLFEVVEQTLYAALDTCTHSQPIGFSLSHAISHHISVLATDAALASTPTVSRHPS